MQKRIFSLLLALVLVFGLLPVTASANELDNGLQYEVYDDSVSIIGYSDLPQKLSSLTKSKDCLSPLSVVMLSWTALM